MKLGILKLPEASSARNGNRFLLQKSNVTDQILFENLTFGLDNASFSPVISAHTTQIEYLSSTVDTLSSNLYKEFDFLESYVNSSFNTAFFNLQYILYPVGAIFQTSVLVNPATLIPNTTWQLISQGFCVGGVGYTVDNGAPYTSGDRNSDTVTFVSGGNNAEGEYSHRLTVAELPSHTHTASMLGETDSSTNGQFAESEGGAEQFNIAPVESDVTGLSAYHNNIPPVYGVYTWLRVG
jgi:hypothetical protein